MLGLFLGGLSLGCGADETPTVTNETDPTGEGLTHCQGDALTAGVAISQDREALRNRFNTNKDLLRVLFLGEPG